MIASGLSEADWGTIIGLNGLVIVLVQPFVIAFIEKRRMGRVLAAGVALLGVGIGSTVLADSWVGFAATVVIWTLGEILVVTFSAPLAADLAPPARRGIYQGWFGFSFAVAFAIGPAGGLWLYEAIGRSGLWITVAVVAAIAALAWLLLTDRIAQRRALATETVAPE